MAIVLPYWEQSKSFVLWKKMNLHTFLLEFSFVKTLVQFFKAMTDIAALKETKSGSWMLAHNSFKNVILIGWRAEGGVDLKGAQCTSGWAVSCLN